MIQLQEPSSELKFPEKLTVSTQETYLWRDLYRQAIFERERTKIPARIREAERALMHREHELCMNKQNSAERESVVTALNCLRALRICMKAAA
jgi:hypothetical protein